MKDFKAIMGMSGTSISHGKLKLMRDELLASLRPLNSQMAYDHRLLNSYLQTYSEKLSLVNQRDLTFSALKGPEELSTLAIDFDEL